MVNELDIKHLRRCIELARLALDKGDQPFGSILVSKDGEILARSSVLQVATIPSAEFNHKMGATTCSEEVRRLYIHQENIAYVCCCPWLGWSW